MCLQFKDVPCLYFVLIRRHSGDIYLGMFPIQNGSSYPINVLVLVGKTSETVANWNN